MCWLPIGSMMDFGSAGTQNPDIMVMIRMMDLAGPVSRFPLFLFCFIGSMVESYRWFYSLGLKSTILKQLIQN